MLILEQMYGNIVGYLLLVFFLQDSKFLNLSYQFYILLTTKL